MNPLPKYRKPPIDPIYWQSLPNEPIEFGDVAVKFQHRDTSLAGNARFAMRFVPDERLELVYPLAELPLSVRWSLIGFGSPYKQIALTDRGVEIRAFCTAAGEDYGGAVFTPSQGDAP